MTPERILRDIQWVKENSPLVHNLTNAVVMNNTANALLAAGASPVMTYAKEEVQDMAAIASSLVLNIGTLTPLQVESMILACTTATQRSIPVILDPVGAGATPLRTESCIRILETGAVTIIRGNGSEIAALANRLQLLEANGTLPITRGVDSTILTDEAIAPAHALAMHYNCTVAVTGETDYITNGNTLYAVTGGSALMGKVTGMGCTSSAICGAFAAAYRTAPEDSLMATLSALTLMAAAGEQAEKQSNGPGTFQAHFLDALYDINIDTLKGVTIQKK